MGFRQSNYYSKFYFSKKEIDFEKEYLNYEHFLLQEFFTADIETANKISEYYYNIYGARSLAYIKRKNSGWINGDYHITDLIRDRILTIMPKFLNEDAKYKLGANEFMTFIKSTIRTFQSNQKYIFTNSKSIKNPQELALLFEKEYEKIQIFKNRNFTFNILTEEEKLEALEISKYILDFKLRKAFDQIEKDFRIFLPYIQKLKRGYLLADYSMPFFNLKIDCTNTKFDELEFPKFKTKQIQTNNRFKDFSDKYLAYELVAINSKSNMASSNSFLNTNDIELFFTHYKKLSYGESEVNINSSFQGEGGILNIKVRLKPIKLLTTSIIISSIKITIYLILSATLLSLIINYELFTLFKIIGSFIGILILININEEIKLLKSLTKEYKIYGQ